MDKLRDALRHILPEERKNRIPCIAFGIPMLVLTVLNIAKAVRVWL